MDERNLPPVRFEQQDVPVRLVAMLGAGALAILLSSAAIIAWIYPTTLHEQLSQPPAVPVPALQAVPRQDMAAFSASENRRLSSYGWIDRSHSIVHIPIATAMARIAHDGIAGWPAAPPMGQVP